MTAYNVHIYRKMRLTYGGIEATTPQDAAYKARDFVTADADSIEDCDGQTFAALVEVPAHLGDSQAVMVVYEAEGIRNAAPQLLTALKAAVAEIEYWHADMLSDEARRHPRGSGWARVYDAAITAIAQAHAKGA